MDRRFQLQSPDTRKYNFLKLLEFQVVSPHLHFSNRHCANLEILQLPQPILSLICFLELASINKLERLRVNFICFTMFCDQFQFLDKSGKIDFTSRVPANSRLKLKILTFAIPSRIFIRKVNVTSMIKERLN